MGDPKICSKNPTDQAAEARVAAEQAAQKSLPARTGENQTQSTFTGPAQLISEEAPPPIRPERFGERAPSLRAKPAHMNAAARVAGVNPVLIAVKEANDNRTKSFIPEGMRLIRQEKDGVETFSRAALKVELVNQGKKDSRGRFIINHEILPQATATYEGYNGKIPITVIEQKNGTR